MPAKTARADFLVSSVVKRDGSRADFDWKKIEKSVILAGRDTKAYTKKEAEKILDRIRKVLGKVKEEEISTNRIRDIVEPAMAEAGYFQTAKYYILFSERKSQEEKKHFKITEPALSDMGQTIVKKRYVRIDMEGKPVETAGEMLWRVAQHMAKAEINWGNAEVVDEMAKAFFERMVSWKLVCAGKAMFEAGNPGGTGQLSSCFVLPIEDNIAQIFKTLGDAAVVHKNNGGTGFNFSKIRQQGDKVKNVPGAATGPVGFIKAFSAALAQILQGAKRQGANIAILNADHPDIREYVHLKDQDGTIKNFNISVGVSNAFMEAVVGDRPWNLVNPRNGEVVETVSAKELFNDICEHAWISGDPGMAFLDRLEEDNPTPTIGPLNATNPCGEIPLLPYESCNLTTISLHEHLKWVSEGKSPQITNDKSQLSTKKQTKSISTESTDPVIGHWELDWEELEKTVKLGIRFLDNMIEVNTYALKEIEDMVKFGNRRIGLGVMGFAHMLYLMRIPYSSKEAVALASRLAKFIQKHAEDTSLELAKVRGTFPNFDISIYAGTAERYRNCALTMIAPTGTISMLVNTSSGIEPVFSLVTIKRSFNEDNRDNRPSREFFIVDPVFESELQKLQVSKLQITSNGRKLETVDEILTVVAEEGLDAIEGLPKWFYKVFVTTHEIAPTWHVQIQAAWQKWFDNSISKTINFSHEATVDDVKEAYIQAWKLGCKGITIYRDGSKVDQVLNLASSKKKDKVEEESSKLQITISNEVPNANVQLHVNGNGHANGNSHTNGNGKTNGHYVEVAEHTEVLMTEMSNGHVAAQSLYVEDMTDTIVKCEECGAEARMVDGCVSCGSCGWSKCSL